MLELPAFVHLLERHLGVDLGPATAESRLREDLFVDSLLMAELLAFFGTEGISLPDELVPELRTIGDLHHYFNALKPHGLPDFLAEPAVVSTGVAL